MGLELAAQAGACFSWAFWCPCVKWGPSEPVGSRAFPEDPTPASRARLDCVWVWMAGALAGRKSRVGASGGLCGTPAALSEGFSGLCCCLLWPQSQRRHLKAPCSHLPPAPRPRVSLAVGFSEWKAAWLRLRSGVGAGRPALIVAPAVSLSLRLAWGGFPQRGGHGAGGAHRTAAPVPGVCWTFIPREPVRAGAALGGPQCPGLNWKFLDAAPSAGGEASTHPALGSAEASSSGQSRGPCPAALSPQEGRPHPVGRLLPQGPGGAAVPSGGGG